MKSGYIFTIAAFTLAAAAAHAAGASTNVNGSAAGTNTGMEGKVYSGTHTPSEASLRSMLPSGTRTYTYYSSSRVYYAPDTKTYYYPAANGTWVTGTVAPEGVKLGNGTNVRIEGLGATNENTIK